MEETTKSLADGMKQPAARSPWAVRGLTAAGLLMIGIVTYSFVGAAKKVTLSNEGLSVDAKYLDFGEVWENEALRWPITIENRRGHDVEISKYSLSCTCLSIEPESEVIGAGESAEATLTIDLTTKRLPAREVTSRELEVKIMPRINGASLPIEGWIVRGRVRRVLQVNRFVQLGSHSELSQPLPTWTVPVELLIPLESLSSESDVPNIKASVEPSEGLNDFTLRLSAVSPLVVGELQGVVRLMPVRKGGELLPVRTIEFGGKIVLDVGAEPQLVQVGGRRVGESFEEVVVLRSLTGRTLAPVRAKVDGDGLSVEALEGNGQYHVRQKVCNVGAQTNRICFSTESAGRIVTVIVPVSYTGFEAE